ncbi:hypothetical protein D3C86_1879680 [compost metagenome]
MLYPNFTTAPSAKCSPCGKKRYPLPLVKLVIKGSNAGRSIDRKGVMLNVLFSSKAVLSTSILAAPIDNVIFCPFTNVLELPERTFNKGS